MRHDLRIEQRPDAVCLDAFHKQIGNPVREIQVVRAAGIVAGIVAEFEKIVDVGVPRFEIDAAGTFSFAALIYGRHARIKRLQPRHDAIRMAVSATYQRPSRTNPMVGNADAARKL